MVLVVAAALLRFAFREFVSHPSFWNARDGNSYLVVDKVVLEGLDVVVVVMVVVVLGVVATPEELVELYAKKWFSLAFVISERRPKKRT